MLIVSAGAHAQSQDKLLKKAIAGDYQAQRNLAYSYANPATGERADKIKSCAWYQVILKSGSDKVSVGDVGNVKVYCGALSDLERVAADGQAAELVKKIYKR